MSHSFPAAEVERLTVSGPWGPWCNAMDPETATPTQAGLSRLVGPVQGYPGNRPCRRTHTRSAIMAAR